MIERRFSHSLVSEALRCRRKAYYRYVEEVPSPLASALLKGRACDDAWNANYSQKIVSETDLPVADVEGLAEAAFRRELDETGGPGEVKWRSDEATERASAVRLARIHHLTIAPDVQPTAVQTRYERTLPSGREFIGFIDLEGYVEMEPCLADNKTGRQRMVPGAADMDLQPFAYAWLTGETGNFAFLRAWDTGKTQDTETVWTYRSEADLAVYEEIVADVERSFIEEDFPRNPTSLFCGQGRCEYFERCMPHRTIHTAS